MISLARRWYANWPAPWGALVVWQCGVPAPQFHGEIMKVSADSINDYIKSLAFAPDPPHAQRELVDFVRWRVGPPGDDSAFIEPESHVKKLTMDDLADGRIIARVKTKTPYPPAGFGPWWTYWWVDARGPSGSYRSVFIAIHDKVDFRQKRRLTFKHHGVTPEYPELSARFSPDYDGLWGRCNSSCCATSTAAADTLGTE